MSGDPAIAAAQRAWDSEGWGGPGRPLSEGLSEGSLAEAAAREALAPLRELHRPVDSLGKTGAKVCATCRDLFGSLAVWPCSSAPLLYSSSELEGDSDAQ